MLLNITIDTQKVEDIYPLADAIHNLLVGNFDYVNSNVVLNFDNSVKTNPNTVSVYIAADDCTHLNVALNTVCLMIDAFRKQMNLPKHAPVQETAKWLFWDGWSGNHDQRIEDATCSECGYIHPIVYGSLDKLAKMCPACKKTMTV